MQKILIVDDSEINREILAAMLETEYEIDMAKGGREAIDILEKKWETYQIVLLDLNMPVMNGYEVLKVMEEKQWLDSLPVICISSETSEASIGKVYELGATDYFTDRLIRQLYCGVCIIRSHCMQKHPAACTMRWRCCPVFFIVSSRSIWVRTPIKC